MFPLVFVSIHQHFRTHPQPPRLMFANLDEEKKARLRERILQAAAAPPPAPVPAKSNSDSDDEQEVPLQHNESMKHASEQLTINAKSTEVEIANIRLFTLDELDLNQLTECKILSLRKNLIHELSAFPQHLAGRLTELDLFDNKIRKVRDFFDSAMVPDPESGSLLKQSVPQAFYSLTKLDLSYNQLRRITGLGSLGSTLKELYLVENKIKVIEGLDSFVHLELLELGGNRIREIGSGLANLRSLQSLWLGKNKIHSIGDSLHSLRELQKLSLQANRLTSITEEAFKEGCNPHLVELYLSENGISTIENLPLHSLHLLDLSFNPIATINETVINPINMPELEEFWLTDGNINDWGEVKKFCGFANTLRTIYVERNPIEQDKRYRDKVYMNLPFVTQIDSWPVLNKNNLEADRLIQRRAS
ncbi:protein phosphatase type 1 regulator-like protein [Leishmania panamensis]|uniref:Protein phosphatase type 1 regulator-like protein n=2 Tax=Leishmania guyanensis species complex TaxID=38579 RepID=A0A088RID3_LEIPA|nr:protein phosphatase type 1 regulator-like protein [Leishmania panamensis]AIN95560.1 protein phosphatase type 1 regulator-like protein [Leishmania panamensis]